MPYRRLLFRTTALCALMAFLTGSIPALASQEVNLPALGAYVGISAPIVSPIIRGIKIDNSNPFDLDFIVDHGQSTLTSRMLKEQSEKMVKFFLAMLTIPNGDLWVNLSPYEKERIVSAELGVTELGRDMLAQDYLLKQLASSLTHPQKQLGDKFWREVYKKSYEIYGNTHIPLSTFNKIWIVPKKAVIFEKDNMVFIVDSKLKVMMDADYRALDKNANLGTDKGKVQQEVMRKIIIPEIEKEVNEGDNFALIRQIYNTFILSVWYKRNLKESILSRVYVDQKKVRGIDLNNKNEAQEIYGQYLKAFKKGVYNLIKEDYEPQTQNLVPRKYFSGGVDWTQKLDLSRAMIIPGNFKNSNLSDVRFSFNGVNAAMTASMPKLMGSIKDLLQMLNEEVEDYEKEVAKDDQAREILANAFNQYSVKEGSDVVDLDLAFKKALGETVTLIQQGDVLYFNIQKPLQVLIDSFKGKIIALNKSEKSVQVKNRVRYLSNFIIRIQVVLETVKFITAHRRLIRTLESGHYWNSVIVEKEVNLQEATEARSKRISGLTEAINRKELERAAIREQREARVTQEPALMKIKRFLAGTVAFVKQGVTKNDMLAYLATQERALNHDLVVRSEQLDGEIKDLEDQRTGLNDKVRKAEAELAAVRADALEKLSVVKRIKIARQMLRDDNYAALEAGLTHLAQIEQDEVLQMPISINSLADLGRNLKLRREQLGYSSQELAVFIGISYQKIGQLEKGIGFLVDNRISEEMELILHYLAEALAIDFNSLHAIVSKFSFTDTVPDDVIDMKTFGRFLKERREAWGDREVMAAATGISLSSINAYESGRNLPSQGTGRGSNGINYLQKVADYLKINYDALKFRVDAIHEGFVASEIRKPIDELLTKEAVLMMIRQLDLNSLGLEPLIAQIMSDYGIPDTQRFQIIQQLRVLNLHNDLKIKNARNLEDQLEAMSGMIPDLLKDIPDTQLNNAKNLIVAKMKELIGDDDVDISRLEDFLSESGYKNANDYRRMKKLVDEFDINKISELVKEFQTNNGDLFELVLERIVEETGVPKENIQVYLEINLHLNTVDDLLGLVPQVKEVVVPKAATKPGIATPIIVNVYQGMSDARRRQLLVEKLNAQLNIIDPSFVRRVDSVDRLAGVIRSSTFVDGVTEYKRAELILNEAKRAGADTGKGYQGQQQREENDLNRRLALYVLYLISSNYGNVDIRLIFDTLYPDISQQLLPVVSSQQAVTLTTQQRVYLEALYQILDKDDFRRLKFPGVVSANTIHMANEKLSASDRRANVSNFISLRDTPEFRTRGRSITPEQFRAFLIEKGLDRAQTTILGQNNGGIDLNEKFLQLQTQGDSSKVHFDLTAINDLHIEGLLPVFIKDTPISDIFSYLGAAPSVKQ